MRRAYIIGAGIHPFGRTDTSGLDQGVFAARAALADAGVEWRDIEFAFGGSSAAGNADITGQPARAHRRPVHQRLERLRDRRLGAVLGVHDDQAPGEFDLGMAVGFDKHPRGAFDPRPAEWGLPDWYGEAGFMLTTQFFAIKIRRYMELHGISPRTLARVAEKAFLNGQHAAHAWRRSPVGTRGNPRHAQMINDPLTKFMFCSPAEGGVALVLAARRRRRRSAGRASRSPQRRSARVRRASSKCSRHRSTVARGSRPPCSLRRRRSKWRVSVRTTSTSRNCRTPKSGAEIMHMAENGFCADGEQERGCRGRRDRIGGTLPINTDGGCLACGEPIGASGFRQVYENVVQLRGQAGARRLERREWPIRRCMAHPASQRSRSSAADARARCRLRDCLDCSSP